MPFLPRFLLFLLPSIATLHAFDSERYMDVSEIQPGMTGHGLTVFKGTKVEKFKVEVISVLRKVRPKRDMILIRAEHPILKTSGIIAGMSGSPVYIKGRMIGAVAYTWSFAEEAMGGITPIREMLEVAERPTEEKSGAFVSPGEMFSFRVDERLPFAKPLASQSSSSLLSEALTMRTIRTPLCVSGLPDFALERMRQHFNLDNLLFVPGGEVSEGEAPAAGKVKLEPGSAVGVEMIEGDVSASGFGTVTEVIGDQVLAFGHPMFGLGKVKLPMSVGYIHGVMPSQMVSFKFGSPLQTLGQIEADESAAIMGRLGDAPFMIPVEVELDWVSENRKDRFTYQVLDHPQFTGRLVDSVLGASLTHRSGPPKEITLMMETRLEFQDGEPIQLGNVYSAPSPVESLIGALNLVLGSVNALLNNDFHEFRLKKVSTQMRIESIRRTAAVTSIRPVATEVAPGETLQIVADIQPYQQEAQFKVLTIKIPENTPEGNAAIHVVDSMARQNLERRDRPNRFQARNLEQFLEIVTRRDDYQSLYLRLVPSGGGVAINGVELPSLPSSIVAALRPSSATGTSVIKEVLEAQHPTPWVVRSNHSVQVSIVRK